MAEAKPEAINPLEWIEIGRIAVRTRSVSVAARIRARVDVHCKWLPRDAQGIEFEKGNELGVEFMALALYRKRLEAQRLAAAIEAAADGYARNEQGRPIGADGAELFFVLEREDDDDHDCGDAAEWDSPGVRR